jgi:hypothetical protein
MGGDPTIFGKDPVPYWPKTAGSNARHIGKSDFAEVKPDMQGTQPG